MDVKIEKSWKKILQPEFEKDYFKELTQNVKHEYKTQTIFPAGKNIFRALDLVPFEKVSVVILGQDPYHTPGVADGLAFSTLPGNKVPPSLQNIYKEIIQEFQIDEYVNYKNPDLTRWAEQGVLLINNTLTVRSGQPNSHASFGWSNLTTRIIELLAEKKENLVFILWGSFARKKKPLIQDSSKSKNSHLILESPHPSPFSASNGFFGNNHFSKCNEWLLEKNLEPINWL